MQLETERLVLRPMALTDLDEFMALHSEPEVIHYLRAFDERQARERLREDAEQWAQRGHGILAIFDGVSRRFLGRTGLRYWPQFDETEIGWALRREEWGQGYATEAGRACLDWAFRELPVPYLTAIIQPRNGRSIRVAERLGLEPLRADVLLGDPVQVYALARETWTARSRPALALPSD